MGHGRGEVSHIRTSRGKRGLRPLRGRRPRTPTGGGGFPRTPRWGQRPPDPHSLSFPPPAHAPCFAPAPASWSPTACVRGLRLCFPPCWTEHIGFSFPVAVGCCVRLSLPGCVCRAHPRVAQPSPIASLPRRHSPNPHRHKFLSMCCNARFPTPTQITKCVPEHTGSCSQSSKAKKKQADQAHSPTPSGLPTGFPPAAKTIRLPAPPPNPNPRPTKDAQIFHSLPKHSRKATLTPAMENLWKT